MVKGDHMNHTIKNTMKALDEIVTQIHPKAIAGLIYDEGKLVLMIHFKNCKEFDSVSSYAIQFESSDKLPQMEVLLKNIIDDCQKHIAKQL